MTRTAYIHGLALSGEALAHQLLRRGWTVVVADDAPDDAKTMAKSALSSNISPSRRDSPTSVIAEMNQSCRQDESE